MIATTTTERTTAFCEHCQATVRPSPEFHTVRLSRTRISVPHVLVHACPTCGDVVAIPRESYPQLRVGVPA